MATLGIVGGLQIAEVYATAAKTGGSCTAIVRPPENSQLESLRSLMPKWGRHCLTFTSNNELLAEAHTICLLLSKAEHFYSGMIRQEIHEVSQACLQAGKSWPSQRI